MESLRRARFMARLVLAWFALSLGIAVAAPIVKPQAVEWVCSAGTAKLVVQGGEGSTPAGVHSWDCPMCGATGAPPPAAGSLPTAALPLSVAVQSIPAARIAGLTAAPLPARGPPPLSSIR